MRLLCTLGSMFATPDLERRKPGRGSVVTVFEFYDHYVPSECRYSMPKARFYDEWGQIGQSDPAWLVVIK